MLDPSSATWTHVTEWANTELSKLRAQLEQPALDDRASTLIRGRIIALKALLALSKAPAERPAESTDSVGY